MAETSSVNEKKRFELSCTNLLVKKLKDFPIGILKPFERPDVLNHLDDEILGIEVTRIFQQGQAGQQPEKQQESEEKIVVDMACKMYESRGFPPLSVLITFTDSAKLNKSNREVLSQNLFDFVRLNIPLPENWNEVDDQKLPAFISSLRVARFSNTENHWSVGRFGWVKDDFVEELQDRIDKKNCELPKYLKNCRRCWLLIVADASGASSFFRASSVTRSHKYKSLFERTFFLDTLHGEIFELKSDESKT